MLPRKLFIEGDLATVAFISFNVVVGMHIVEVEVAEGVIQ